MKRAVVALVVIALLVAVGFTVADVLTPVEPHFDEVVIRMDDGSIVRGHIQFMEEPDEEGMVRVSIDDLVYRVPADSVTIITR